MPWNDSYFPQSMRNLAAPARAKAIEIANALLAQGYDEGKCIRIGIAQATHWAGHRTALRGQRRTSPGRKTLQHRLDRRTNRRFRTLDV
jgi:hypothetical protein